jgi:hypothetical protein
MDPLYILLMTSLRQLMLIWNIVLVVLAIVYLTRRV